MMTSIILLVLMAASSMSFASLDIVPNPRFEKSPEERVRLTKERDAEKLIVDEVRAAGRKVITPLSEAEYSKLTNLYFLEQGDWYFHVEDIVSMASCDINLSLKGEIPGFPKSQASEKSANDCSKRDNLVIKTYSEPGKPQREDFLILNLNANYMKAPSNKIFIDDNGGVFKFSSGYYQRTRILLMKDLFYRAGLIWDPYKKVRAYQMEEEEGEFIPDEAYGKKLNMGIFIPELREVNGETYLRLGFNVADKPVWVHSRRHKELKQSVNPFVGSFFSFDNMPPVIESADGRTVYLVDHKLKDQIKDKTIKLLIEENDKEFWLNHYCTKIENGYLYFNSYPPIAFERFFKWPYKKAENFYTKLPVAERRVHLKYIIRQDGTANFYSDGPSIYTKKNFSDGFIREGMDLKEIRSKIIELNPKEKKWILKDISDKFLKAILY